MNDHKAPSDSQSNSPDSSTAPALSLALVSGLVIALTVVPAASAAGTTPMRVTDANFQKLVASSWPAHGSALWMQPSSGCTAAEGSCNGLAKSHLGNGGVYVCDPTNTQSLCHECVSFVKTLANNSLTTDKWNRGSRVIDGAVRQGTVVATFTAPNNKYDGAGSTGKGHVGIFDAYWYDSSGRIVGFTMYDQNWVQPNGPGTGIVAWHALRADSSLAYRSNAGNYHVVLI